MGGLSPRILTESETIGSRATHRAGPIEVESLEAEDVKVVRCLRCDCFLAWVDESGTWRRYGPGSGPYKLGERVRIGLRCGGSISGARPLPPR